MIELASILLAVASWLPTQEWSFLPADPGDSPVVGYRMYWSSDPACFNDAQRQYRETNTVRIDPSDLVCETGRCYWGDMNPPSGDVVYFQWTAVDADGDETAWGNKCLD